MTLLESMITLVIAAILLGLAVPGLSAMMQDARRSGRVDSMVGSLNLARSEAIKRNQKVTVCPSADGQQCSGDNHWETGWVVFSDPNSNGVVEDGESVLHTQEGLGGEGTMRGSRTRLTYQTYGFSLGFTDTLRVCDERGTDSARSLVVSNQGRVRVKAGADSCP